MVWLAASVEQPGHDFRSVGALMDGHVHAFAFFGRVPQSIVYNNDRCLVAQILPDGSRKRARLFSVFLSHYVIEDRYGRPGKGTTRAASEDWSVMPGGILWCRSPVLRGGAPSMPRWKSYATHVNQLFCAVIAR
jgi:hypothetical protein